jgi:leader peptidase (prepilin peptidase)/N-methyltransferase
LLIILKASKGRAMGGGDVKLMAATGLLLGYKNIILALVLGCVLGSIIHVALMKIQNKERMLAMGPYLSMGIYISMVCGNELVNWYLTSFVNY